MTRKSPTPPSGKKAKEKSLEQIAYEADFFNAPGHYLKGIIANDRYRLIAQAVAREVRRRDAFKRKGNK